MEGVVDKKSSGHGTRRVSRKFEGNSPKKRGRVHQKGSGGGQLGVGGGGEKTLVKFFMSAFPQDMTKPAFWI